MNAQVLLSTYNGERYLAPLMDSLLAQDYSDLSILVRDDGSTDGTCALLQRYGHLPNVKLVFEDNIGVIRSYLKLLRMSSTGAHYFAFCDQDDVWLPGKVSAAVRILEKCPADVPAACTSRVMIVDGDLREQSLSPSILPRPSLANALVENVMSGCAQVINRRARDLIMSADPDPGALIMHDWWAYLVTAAFGCVVFDPEAHILYRQHAANAVGVRGGSWGARLERWRKPSWALTRQARELARLYGDLLEPEKARVLAGFLAPRMSWLSRLRYAIRGEPYRTTWFDNLIFKALILLDRI